VTTRNALVVSRLEMPGERSERASANSNADQELMPEQIERSDYEPEKRTKADPDLDLHGLRYRQRPLPT
jgi:hypothetical protein